MRRTVEHHHGHHSEHGALYAPEAQAREHEHELHNAAGGSRGSRPHTTTRITPTSTGAASGSRLILAIPVVVYSEMIQDWFGYTAPDFPGDGWVAPGPRHGHLLLRRLGLPDGRVVGDPRDARRG